MQSSLIRTTVLLASNAASDNYFNYLNGHIQFIYIPCQISKINQGFETIIVTSTSGQEGIPRGQIYPPSWITKKIWTKHEKKNGFWGTWTLGKKGQWSPNDRKEMQSVLLLLRFTVLREFSGHDAERMNVSRGQRTPHIEDMELKGQRHEGHEDIVSAESRVHRGEYQNGENCWERQTTGF